VGTILQALRVHGGKIASFGDKGIGLNYVPVGMFGQFGATWASQPNDSQGQPVVSPNGSVSAYEFTGEVGPS